LHYWRHQEICPKSPNKEPLAGIKTLKCEDVGQRTGIKTIDAIWSVANRFKHQHCAEGLTHEHTIDVNDKLGLQEPYPFTDALELITYPGAPTTALLAIAKEWRDAWFAEVGLDVEVVRPWPTNLQA
jgi:hypothetical protein